MQTMPRISALILGLSLAAGCSKSSPDTAAPDDGAAYEEDMASESFQATERPMRVTGVYLDPALTAVCELDDRNNLLELDAEAEDRMVERTLAAVAACVKTGPLQGRRLELVGYATGEDEFRRSFGKTRAETVREVLVKGGIPTGDIVTNAAAEEDPDAAATWPSERRVDIRVATRHAR
jgi:outer membrane protein OmpA-like peptidoglycan-associated protein